MLLATLDQDPLTEPVVVVLTTLALLVQILVVIIAVLALASLASGSVRTVFDGLRSAIAGNEVWLAFGVAFTATAGSLFFQLYSGFEPCPLCWYQRYAMYPLVVLLPIVAVFGKGKRWPLMLVSLLPLAGGVIASLHRYEEAFPTVSFCSKGSLCVTRWLESTSPLDYITIPTLALTAFVAILVLLAFALFPPKSVVSGTAAAPRPGTS